MAVQKQKLVPDEQIIRICNRCNREMAGLMCDCVYPEYRLYVSLAQAEAIMSAIFDGGFDISPCRLCGKPIVCIPYGVPVCNYCSSKG